MEKENENLRRIENNKCSTLDRIDELCERYNNDDQYTALDFGEHIMAEMGYR